MTSSTWFINDFKVLYPRHPISWQRTTRLFSQRRQTMRPNGINQRKEKEPMNMNLKRTLATIALLFATITSATHVPAQQAVPALLNVHTCARLGLIYTVSDLGTWNASIKVQQTTPGLGCAMAGLEPGDRIWRINNQRVMSKAKERDRKFPEPCVDQNQGQADRRVCFEVGSANSIRSTAAPTATSATASWARCPQHAGYVEVQSGRNHDVHARARGLFRKQYRSLCGEFPDDVYQTRQWNLPLHLPELRWCN